MRKLLLASLLLLPMLTLASHLALTVDNYMDKGIVNFDDSKIQNGQGHWGYLPTDVSSILIENEHQQPKHVITFVDTHAGQRCSSTHILGNPNGILVDVLLDGTLKGVLCVTWSRFIVVDPNAHTTLTLNGRNGNYSARYFNDDRSMSQNISFDFKMKSTNL